jgi:subtilisin family serine protease
MSSRFFSPLLVVLLATPAAAARGPLDLPVRVAGGPRVAAPAYAGDVVEIQLAPTAARRALPAYRAGVRDGRLGVPGMDAAAAALGGVRFEPLFRGERTPAEGANGPDFTSFYVAHLPRGLNLEQALSRFASLPEVASVTPIAILPLDAVPDDSLWSSSYWYYQASRMDVHAPEAWDITTGDTSVVVGIIDTGVLPYHPDLGGSVAGVSGQIYTNWAEANGLPGVDDDGNGYVDDIHGWDFVALPDLSDVYPGEDGLDEDNDPNDFVAHGTGVAGMVGALTNNTIGVAGMNWNVRLMPLRVGWAYPGSGLGSGEIRMDFVVKAIRYATLMGCKVVNCSFETLNEPGLDAALDGAAVAGMTVVVAAGNTGGPNYLATRRDVISVAGTNAVDNVGFTSSLGPQVDLAAPGVNIATTWLQLRPFSGDSIAMRQPSYRGGLSGTSFSSPIVAGAAALLQARQHQLGKPPLDPMAILLRLYETADDIRAQNPGLDGMYGGGRLNVARALTETWRSRVLRLSGKVVGSAAVMRVNDGSTRVVFATDDRKLVMLNGATLDTVWIATLPFVPVTGPALDVFPVDPVRGVAIFVGLGSGRVAGYRWDGTVLPGWPVVSGTRAMRGGPALGDLDGDGVDEIVTGADDGALRAWRLNGSMLSNQFPLTVSPGIPMLSPAIVPTNPPRIVAATQDGTVTVADAAGNVLSHWPVLFPGSPTAPVIARINGAPSIVIAEDTNLHALDLAAVERPGFPVNLGASTTSTEVAIGDIDQNGVDDVVLPVKAPTRLEVRDSTGTSLTPLGWPRALFSAPVGPPGLGHLSGVAAPDVMLPLSGGLTAFTSHADSLSAFPKPGGGGTFPTLFDLDGDGMTEVLAGSTLDRVLFVYDTGQGSAAASLQPWPTFRGSFQRTGSVLNRGATPELDQTPPGGVSDLSAAANGAGTARLRWTAPGDDGAVGTARRYELRRSTSPIDPGNFTSGTAVATPPPHSGGTPENLDVSGLLEGVTHYFALRAIDDNGNVGPLSNVASVTLAQISPAAVTDLHVIGVTDSSVTLAWTATGDDGNVGRPALYAVHGANAPIDDANFPLAPYTRNKPATVDAGGGETLLVKFLPPAQPFWFALKAYDASNNISPLSNVVATRTGVGGPLDSRPGMALAPLQNPARAPVQIYWQASADGVGTRQVIRIFDLTGRKLRTLEAGTGLGGVVAWDGRDDSGNRLNSGLYIAQLESGPHRVQRKMVVVP